MTRQLRLEYPGAVYHLMSRGDRRNAIYRDDGDRSRSRHHQAAFRTWVYLMRRVANLNLSAAARRAGVSPGRVSQIQSAMESEERPAQLDALLARYKV